MNKRLFSCVAACMLFCAGVSAQVFLIERTGSAPLTFDNIKEAVDALQDNDRLYIPAGVHDIGQYNWEEWDEASEESIVHQTNAIAITKKVAIYGGGYSGEDAGFLANGTLILTKEASGSLITGLGFKWLQLNNVSNVSISRCLMTDELSYYGNGGNNLMSECDIMDVDFLKGTFDDNSVGIHAVKCVFRGTTFRFNSSTIENCLFATYNSVYPLLLCNSTISNCIFIVDKTTTSKEYKYNVYGSAFFNNNLFVGGTITKGGSATLNNNIEKVLYTETFVDAPAGNYRLQDSSPAKDAGTDGTDIGLYGTDKPFDDSRRPALPYFKVKSIGTETDVTGKLPVNIVIEAQEY